MVETFLTAFFGGVVSGAITVITLKVDVKWIKEILAEQNQRITFLERNI